MKRILLTGGGTAGHVTPNIALLPKLRELGYEISYMGSYDGIEKKLIEEFEIPYYGISSGKLRRYFDLKNFSDPFRVLKGYGEARRILKRCRPDVIFSKGGFVAVPVVLAAKHFKIPVIIHESDMTPGLANKICARWTDLFLLGLPVNDKIRNAVLVGTPIRREFAEPVDRRQTLLSLGLNPDFKTVLLFGGSQGAKALNQALIEAVKRLVAENDDVQFIHISGERWYETISARYGKTSRVNILPYSNEIYDVIHACDLAVCRSGAGTLAELAYCKKPALLVPLPSAAANHQFYNAKVLQSVGCAALVQQGSQLAAELYPLMDRMLNAANNSVLQTMKENYAKLGLPDPMGATEEIARLLKKL